MFMMFVHFKVAVVKKRSFVHVPKIHLDYGPLITAQTHNLANLRSDN